MSDTVNSKFSGVIGKSPSMEELVKKINKVANFKTTLLITGESGTGKELIAKCVHEMSPRSNKPFVAVNCGAIPENLIESELFGHKRGSFTDAIHDKIGLFREADGGTIFLDEIGELPLNLQAKLLRALQDSQIRPVGGEEVIPVDLRVIAATLRDLEQDSLNGRFREDLFFRLHVVELKVPALRERIEDLPELIEFLLKKICVKLKTPLPKLAKETEILFKNYTWPGNIRELENYLERATILSENQIIEPKHLPSKLFSDKDDDLLFSSSLPSDNLSIKDHTKELEENLIRKALKLSNNNKTKAAKLLEISHRTLLYKIRDYNLQ